MQVFVLFWNGFCGEPFHACEKDRTIVVSAEDQSAALQCVADNASLRPSRDPEIIRRIASTDSADENDDRKILFDSNDT